MRFAFPQTNMEPEKDPLKVAFYVIGVQVITRFGFSVTIQETLDTLC